MSKDRDYLYPIERPGDQAEPGYRELGYVGERGFIGVDDPKDEEYRGFNAHAAWTRRIHRAITAEHDEYGVHDTPKIARGVCVLLWNDRTRKYEVDPQSYLLGDRQRDVELYRVTVTGDGTMDVELTRPLPVGSHGVFGLSEAVRQFGPRGGVETSWDVFVDVSGTLQSRTLVAIERVPEYPHGEDGHHGDVAFAIYGGQPR